LVNATAAAARNTLARLLVKYKLLVRRRWTRLKHHLHKQMSLMGRAGRSEAESCVLKDVSLTPTMTSSLAFLGSSLT